MLKLSKKQASLLFITAFLVRIAVFWWYVQHDTRYQQPDSMDYHNCTLGIILGTGMHRADTMEPIFWRTPGYPVYLAPFYYLWRGTDTGFNDWTTAHHAAIFVQIIICSLIPILVWLLAYLLTHNYVLALIAGWITVFHPGFVLASTYILTEGLAVFLFLLFLLFFYQQLRITNSTHFSRLMLISAALILGIYTWMRPMGEFVAIIALLLIILCRQGQWSLRLRNMIWFATFFWLSLAPWYIRNHALTGQWFFCPMSGPYLNSFSAPKIVRTVQGMTLENSIRLLYGLAHKRIDEARQALAGSGYTLARETVCGAIAWPIIQAHPWIFMRDWVREVIKTTFDLYAYQFVAMANNTFKYDPLEEFLSEKIAACLYAGSIPWWIRSICYAELLYALWLWLGLLAGAWSYMLRPIIQHLRQRTVLAFTHLQLLWWQVTPLIGAVFMMTGGFGYARLRLPIEGLMIILSLSWWLRTTISAKNNFN
jgi:4-amino-4-deoxy-L-arabinose transferase-like glycosyltransferase